MKRFSILKAGGLAPLAILALMGALSGGCASQHCGNDDWHARNRADREHGQQLARMAPCDGHCGGSCEQHRQPCPQPDPVVINKPCAETGQVVIPGQEWSKLVGVDVSGSIMVQDWTSNCDGSNRCDGQLVSIPVNGSVSMPVTGQVGPFAIPITLTARPGEACPPGTANKP